MPTLTANDLTLVAETPSAYPFIRWIAEDAYTSHDGVQRPAGQELAALTAHHEHPGGEQHEHVDLYTPNRAGVGKTTITVPLYQDPPAVGGANPATSGKRQVHIGGYLMFVEGCPVMRSPDGKWWMLTVSNAGQLVPVAAPAGLHITANKT